MEVRQVKTKKPTPKVAAGAAASSATSVVLGAADELGIDVSWLTSKPILFGLVVSAIGFAAAWLKREVG